ncbi:MAG TPA: pyridoxamine 5'-phosphate oxidase family protein [Candidatus Sulfotelmatobacter sp.]|nr:pyridoxamine 5'-phosphate oxidase family protein [Candidatus Sulfotelmatobacter sp.]
MTAVKIYRAMPMAPGMDRSEIDAFLARSKTPLRLGTTNSKGEPNIHPVWYEYVNNKLYLMSYKEAVKVRNLKQNKTVYFSVDTDAMPNTGVKGKGTAIIVKDMGKAVSLSEKIVAKYLGDLNSTMAKNMVDQVRKESEVLIEITPHFFSTWDYTKSKF